MPNYLGIIYFPISIEYYVAGRALILNQLIKIPGNLFHHGIEFLLKGIILMDTHDKHEEVEKKLRYEIQHDLKKLWQLVKEKYPDGKLAEFDKPIDSLDGWEDIRYPPKNKSVSKTVGSGKPFETIEVPRADISVGLYLEEMDELYKTLWLKFVETPSYKFENLLFPKAKILYEQGNKHKIY